MKTTTDKLDLLLQNFREKYMPATAEYGSEMFQKHQSIYTALDTKHRAMLCGKPREVTLYHRTPGYVSAGSCARLQTSHVWGYTWNDGRTDHGRMFNTLEAARAAFDATN